MKRKLLIFFAIFAMAISTSCSKDDDVPSEAESFAQSLIGTVWSEIDGTVEKSVEFTSQTRCTYTIASTVLTVSAEMSYIYDCDEPYVYLTALDAGMADLTARVSNNTMIVTNDSTGENIAYLTKE